MQFFTMLVRWGVVLLASAVGVEVTPTQKVITMLEGMVVKGTADMKEEQVLYASVKQFCDETITGKGREIEEAEATIEEMSASIEKATASLAQAHDKQLLHDTDASHWKGDLKAATAVRAIERGDYEKTHQDYSESVDALRRAIQVLSSEWATSKALVQVERLKLPAEAKKELSAFLQHRTGTRDEPAVPDIEAYTGSSHSIVQLLKNLLTKFSDEKTSLENRETQAVQNFAILEQHLSASIAQAEAQSATMVTRKNEMTEKIAAHSSTKEEYTTILNGAKKYSADLNATCLAKAAAFESRQGLRSQELQALEKTIAVLNGDVVPIAVKHLPVDANPASSMAQLFLGSRSPVQQRLVQFLESQATRLNSRVLSSVALHAASDPFAKVKRMLEDLIARLQSQAGEESDHKSWCDSELAANEQTRKTKNTTAESLHVQIDELMASIQTRTQHIAELNDATSQAHEDLKKAMDVRAAEHADNSEQITDSSAAIDALSKAMTVLREFYAKAGQATALTQDEPQMPKIFNDPYLGMQSENSGVIGMLQVISSDFSRLKAEATAAEAKAIEEHETFAADTHALIEENTKDIRAEEFQRQDEAQALERAKADLQGVQKEFDAALSYFDKLKSSCVQVGVDPALRANNREEEIASLQKALEILSP